MATGERKGLMNKAKPTFTSLVLTLKHCPRILYEQLIQGNLIAALSLGNILC